MEADNRVLASLEAKSKETSLEELQLRGKKKVRVIKASDVAWMVQEAVEAAFSSTDWVPPEKVEELVDKGRSEFEQLKTARMREHAEQKARAEEVERLSAELAAATAEIERLRVAPPQAPAAPSPPGNTGGSGGPPVGEAAVGLMFRMMEELQSLRMQVHTSQGAAPAAGGAPAPAAGGGGEIADVLAGKLDEIVGSLDDRLEKFGKKMGISSAIESGDINYDGLFEKSFDAPEGMESNMDEVELEKREGKSIADNLARIKKLRGGG